jgi:hypothetical protein
MKLVNYVRPN